MQRAEMVVPVLRHVSPDTVLGRIAVATDGQTIGEKELRIGRLLVGRTPENDLQIDSKYVSRHHCQITVALEGAVVEDLNSTNGIVHRGKRVRRHLLRDGDVIVIGQHTLTYVDERPGTPRASSDTGAADPNATGSHETLEGALPPEAGSGPH